MKTLKSYKVCFSDTGTGAFHIIINSSMDSKRLTQMFRRGMNVTVVDDRSALVDRNYVD